MGSVTIRNLDDDVKERARLTAAQNGRSLEAELRALLEHTYVPTIADRAARIREMSGEDWVRELIEIAGGVGLQLPGRHDRVGDDRDVFGAD